MMHTTNGSGKIDGLSLLFTEWERRYRENPEQYLSEAQKLLTTTPKTYGHLCAPYFLQLASEYGIVIDIRARGSQDEPPKAPPIPVTRVR